MALDLTPKRYAQLLQDMDITNGEAAHFAGVAESSVYRWLRGTSPIPASVIRMHELQLVIKRGHDMIKVQWSEPPATEERND